MTDQLAGSLLSVAAVLMFVVLTVRHGMNERRRLEQIDRNARAYGWSVGRGAPMDAVIESGDDNPFHDPDWRERIIPPGLEAEQ